MDPVAISTLQEYDAFRDPHMDGFLENGKLFTTADSSNFGLTGLAFGPSNNQLLRLNGVREANTIAISSIARLIHPALRSG